MSNGVAHGELMLFDCPRVRKSEFWQFIKLVAPHGSPPEGQSHWLSQDATDAYCLKCAKMFRFTKGSSNSVRRHMERFHRKELLKRQADGKKVSLATATRKNSAGATTTAAAASAVAAGAARKAKRAASAQDGELLGDDSAMLIANATQAAAQLAMRGPKRHRADDPRHGVEALVKWLVLTMRPLSIVEEPGFASFAEAISGDQLFVVPSREAICHRLELMAENARFEVKQKVKKEVNHYALSAEIWRTRVSDVDPTTVDSHVAIRCSYLSEEFASQSCVLDVVPIESLSSDKLLGFLQDAGLAPSSLSLLLLQDSGKLELAVASAQLRAVADVAGELDALVSGMLRDQDNNAGVGEELSESAVGKRREAFQAMHAAIADALRVVDWARSESAAHAKLGELSPSALAELAKFPGGAPAKWSLATAHDVVSRLVLLRGSLDKLVGEWNAPPTAENARVRSVSTASWLVLEGLLVLWRPLHEVVQVAANEKVCSLPFILPILAMAMQLFARTNLFDDVKQRYSGEAEGGESPVAAFEALEQLRSHLQRGLDDRYQSLCSTLPWVSALDPRYARLRHLSDAEREECKEQLLEQATGLYASQMPPVPPAPESLGSLPPDFESDIMYGESRPSSQGIPGLMHRLLYDEDEDVAVATDAVISRETEIAQARLYVANEISVYLSEHQLRKTRIVCPLQWWSANRERFPLLAPLARVWLSTRACAASLTAGNRVISSELCDSLGRKQQTEQWVKLVGDIIVLQGHLQSVPSGSVSL